MVAAAAVMQTPLKPHIAQTLNLTILTPVSALTSVLVIGKHFSFMILLNLREKVSKRCPDLRRLGSN